MNCVYNYPFYDLAAWLPGTGQKCLASTKKYIHKEFRSTDGSILRNALGGDLNKILSLYDCESTNCVIIPTRNTSTDFAYHYHNSVPAVHEFLGCSCHFEISWLAAAVAKVVEGSCGQLS